MKLSNNRRSVQVSPSESGTVNPDTGPTAPGYNQSLREVSRILIAVVGVFLWLDHPKTAFYCEVTLWYIFLSKKLKMAICGLG